VLSVSGRGRHRYHRPGRAGILGAFRGNPSR